jgi:hypothetical protein
MNKVDFFIIGAAKSGTTYLARTLSKHKNIFIPTQEPVFFSNDLFDLTVFNNIKDYHKLFGSNLYKKEIICGEKTSLYFATDAVEKIYKYNRNAKIILILRNPIEAVQSYFNHNKKMGFENINDFKDAWDLEELRVKKNYKIPFITNNEIVRLRYRFIYSYFIHIKKIKKIYKEENIKILFYDDLVQDPKAIINELFNFLGVDQINPSEINIEKINETAEYIKINKRIILNSYLTFLPRKKIIRKVFKFIFFIKSLNKIFFKIYLIFSRILIKNNNINQKKEFESNDISERCKIFSNSEYLKGQFKDQIIELEKIINKNLQHWYN